MLSLVPTVLLGLLGVLQVLKCHQDKPAIVCWLKNLSDLPVSKIPCTHIAFGSYEVDHYYSTLIFHIRHRDLTTMMKVRRAYPNVKFVPYFSSFDIKCPPYRDAGIYYNGIEWNIGWDDLEFRKYAYSDGIAFNADALPDCDGRRASYCLNMRVMGGGDLVLNKTKDCGENDWIEKLYDVLVPSKSERKVSIAYTRSEHLSVFDKIFKSQLMDVDMVAWEYREGDHIYHVKPEKLLLQLKLDLSAGLTNRLSKSKLPQSGMGGSNKICDPQRGSGYYCGQLSKASVISQKSERIAQRGIYAFKQGFRGITLNMTEDHSLPDMPGSHGVLSHEESPQLLKDAVVYCMWKDTVVDPSHGAPPTSGCSFVGFEPTSAQDKAILKGFTHLSSCNPKFKLILALNLKYFLRDSYEIMQIQTLMKLYDMTGIDIILDEDLQEYHLKQAIAIVEEIKRQPFVKIMIITITSGHFSIYTYKSLKMLAQFANYINIAHFYGYDKDTASNVISPAPLTSAYDDQSIAFSVSHAIRLDIPPDKILVGLPNFGYMYTVNNDTSLKEISFREVCDMMRSISHSTGWDPLSATPYINSYDMFVSYENSTSIQKKFNLVAKRGLAGVSIYWIDSAECHEISSDGKTLSMQIKEIVGDKTSSDEPGIECPYPSGLLDDLLG